MIFGLRCSFWNQDKIRFHFITYFLLTYSFIPVLPFFSSHIYLLRIKSRGFKAKYSLFIYFVTVERTAGFVHDRHVFNHWAMPQLWDLQLNKTSLSFCHPGHEAHPDMRWVQGLKQMDDKKQLACLPMKDVRRSRQRQGGDVFVSVDWDNIAVTPGSFRLSKPLSDCGDGNVSGGVWREWT